MTLPTTGPISLADVNVELGRASNAPISLGETAVRTLAGLSSGQLGLSNLRGKTNGYLAALTVTPGAKSASGYNYKGYSSTQGIGSRSPTTLFSKNVAEAFIAYETTTPAWFMNVGVATGGGAGPWDAVTSVTVAGVTIPCRFSIDQDIKGAPMGSHTLAPDATPGWKFWPLALTQTQYNQILAAMNAGPVTFYFN